HLPTHKQPRHVSNTIYCFPPTSLCLDHRWQTDREISSCDSCSLVVQNNSIHCSRGGLYFSYAHVTFIEKKGQQTRGNVTLYKNARYGRVERLLFMAVDSTGKGGSVSVSKIIKLEEGDSVSLSISNDCLTEPHDTYWGAFRILKPPY
uniref:THD domain-containing protein n=1 Tax=Myripristis murdjan TaxID=586833 RepID=A0A667WWE0_9TELE